ncbi:GGDEF domain-containing protein [Luteimonas sp. MC1828]|uniref:GGDEF domain-containing protein n=1 Tax=Luteimonas sp. MC1828 TaxID=2799787 RepID=UPI0018F25258|nr:GGDEF domain-containing protein [Luteimonas sp. MC1828]MBJ7573880.1 GGDEF domain-containing protein [Luteimonas sp. MC1828]
MSRYCCVALLWLALVGAPVFAADAPEAAVAEIERLGTTAHWRESDVRIAALASRPQALTAEQRQRIDHVRLRNLALAGQQPAALDGLVELLRQDLPAPLRVRVYTTAIRVAANLERWTLAFGLLGEGLTHLPQAPAESARLLGAASYLHTLVGETGKARDLALRALAHVDADGDPGALCRAVTDVAMAADHASDPREAEAWRHRQIDACTRAGDLVMIANGKLGVGKTAARQERHAEALDWSRRALADFEAAGFEAGAWSARLAVAEGLIESSSGPGEAEALLADTLAYYSDHDAHFAIAETEQLIARLAERRGEPVQALAHFKRSMAASEAAERDARERRLAYLQVEFDTRLKEQQIALLEAEKELAAVQATATRRRQLLLAGGMGGMLVIAILLFGLLRRSIRERRRYRWQSQHDGLTRLYNYQQVRRLGAKAFTRARGDGRPFTAIVADIDKFKQVNDDYGHAAGDEALRSLGAWITDIVGGQGIAGRSGGDEFTILLDADAATAGALMERLRARIEPVTVFGQRVDFNVSAGICQDDGETASLEQLIHRADRALYRAKHGGRDRVVLARAPGADATAG